MILTLDVHEGTELDSGRIMVHSVDICLKFS
jgi:hypothetical protein